MKAWRWILVSLAAVIVLTGLLVWDAIRRAEAAIDAHERQVAVDIGDLRARLARRAPPPTGLPGIEETSWASEEELPRLRELVESGVFYDYEFKDPRRSHLWWIVDFGDYREIRPPFNPELILAELATAHSLHRGGGFNSALIRVAAEFRTFGQWRGLLQDHDLTADRLRTLAATLDQIQRERPTLGEAIEGQRLLAKTAMIQLHRTGIDRNEIIKRGPSWRSLFLRKLFIARTLRFADQAFQDIRAVDAFPIPEREPAADRLGREWENTAVSLWSTQPKQLYLMEEGALKEGSLMRLATAIAWYEAEKGRFPETLDELVPRYIATISADPNTPFTYSKGTLADPATKIVWRIARKPKGP